MIDHNNLTIQLIKYLIIIFETIIYQLLNYLYHNLIVFLSSPLKDQNNHNLNHAQDWRRKLFIMKIN